MTWLAAVAALALFVSYALIDVRRRRTTRDYTIVAVERQKG